MCFVMYSCAVESDYCFISISCYLKFPINRVDFIMENEIASSNVYPARRY